MSKQNQEQFQFQRPLIPVTRFRPIIPKPPMMNPGFQGNQIFQANCIGSERFAYGFTHESQANKVVACTGCPNCINGGLNHLKAASIGSNCFSGYSNEQRQWSLNQGDLNNAPFADQLTLVNATPGKTTTAVSEGIDRHHLECSSAGFLPVHPNLSAQQYMWIDGNGTPRKHQNIDFKTLVSGPIAREQTSKFLQMPVDQQIFYRQAPSSRNFAIEEVDEEEDIELIKEPDIALMASGSSHPNTTKSTPKMSVEEIKRRASKRKNPIPSAKLSSDATSFLPSPRKVVKLTPATTPNDVGEVNLSFPAGFLSRGQGSSISISRADADKLLFPEPRRQLSVLPAGQVCDEGSSFLIHALQHSLMTRHSLDNLEREVVTLKTKVKDAIKSREKAEEWASKVETLLAERTKELVKRNAEVKGLNEKVDFLVEEAKDVESFIIMKTRAQLFKQFLDGKSTTWDAQGELDFFLSNVGDVTDLVLKDEVRKDGDATGDVGVSTSDSVLPTDDLANNVGVTGGVDDVDA